MSALLTSIDARGVATLTLNRPERHNAFDDHLVHELTEALGRLEKLHDVRVVVLGSVGQNFSSGADLEWMRRMASFGEDDNTADAHALAQMLHMLDRLNKPTVGVVQGPAYGGGVGLLACCDTVLASDRATFCLSEVKLGLTPATIAPYVLNAIGARQARRYFLTAEVFSARRALEIGLVHEVVPGTTLAEEKEVLLDALMRGAPGAQAAAKSLIFHCENRAIDDDLRHETARRIAERRRSREGQEGIAAFLNKRLPAWREE
ncbi:MAG: enoyl-CoA hydratase/isomerase family protein [Acetobacteraceae bacterium]|nr:enoyl-CoA hydratase/isomerase family protein [Acetobacteraceae bacterium]